MGAQWNIINKNYKNLEGYKRVAWPPASEERIVREFTPQPQQSPAPGSGGYYQQQHQQQPAASAAAAAPSASSLNAAPAQGPIYNNVQPRTQQQQPHQYQQPQQQQQYYQQPQQPAQNVYGPNTNYASNGYAPAAATVAAPQDPNNYPQQPIQYTQAQFNRQPSR